MMNPKKQTYIINKECSDCDGFFTDRLICPCTIGKVLASSLVPTRPLLFDLGSGPHTGPENQRK